MRQGHVFYSDGVVSYTNVCQTAPAAERLGVAHRSVRDGSVSQRLRVGGRVNRTGAREARGVYTGLFYNDGR